VAKHLPLYEYSSAESIQERLTMENIIFKSGDIYNHYPKEEFEQKWWLGKNYKDIKDRNCAPPVTTTDFIVENTFVLIS
jgi:hypothetical protein